MRGEASVDLALMGHLSEFGVGSGHFLQFFPDELLLDGRGGLQIFGVVVVVVVSLPEDRVVTLEPHWDGLKRYFVVVGWSF